MMTKLRASVFAILSGVLLLPAVASAQVDLATVETTSALKKTGIWVLIMTLMKWLLYIVGILAVIAFVISGIMYLTSAGDDTKTEKAKNAMVAAIIGVIVALIGLIVLTAVQAWLGGGDRF